MTDISLKLIKTDSKGNIWLVLFVLERSITENFKIPYIEIPNINKTEMFDLNIELFERFTPIEKEITKLLFSNLTNNEIANKLNKSVNTIKSHLTTIYLKTKTNSRFEFQKKMLLN